MNKNISKIEYNCLNLPCKVTFGDGSTLAYFYAADGRKLRTVYKSGGTATTTDYCGKVIYEDNVRQLLLTEEGYVSLSDGKYRYYQQDHLGNVRLVLKHVTDSSATVEERNDYYPWGGLTADFGNVQPYKYNGKELDTRKGLNWYDYGARMYDPAVGRFLTMDPKGDKLPQWSPYAYCYDSPVKHIDPDGEFPIDTFWDIANVVYDVGAAVVNYAKGDTEAAKSNLKDLGMDVVALATPYVPAGVSKVSKIAKVANKATDAQANMRRGVMNEKMVLNDMRLTKNTEKLDTTVWGTDEKIKVIPDAITDDDIYEIKDVIAVYATKQIRGEFTAAMKQGKNFVLVIGEWTYVSPKMPEGIQYIKRTDIGPQK